jgi:hypothetical protein
MAWFMALLALVIVAMGAGGAVFLASAEPVRQQVANTLATFGFGDTLEGARLERMSCTTWRSTGRGGGAVHHCDATVLDASGRRAEVEIASSVDIEDVQPVRIARIGRRIGIGFPLGTTLADWLSNLFFFAVLAAMSAFGLWALRMSLRLIRRARLVRRAVIVEVDLLRRRMLGKHEARWDYAFDQDGRRHFTSEVVDRAPVVTDGVVTSGAAMVAPGARAALATMNLAELELAPAERDRLAAQISSAYHAYRPPLRDDFNGLVALTPPGPQRDYLEAYREVWQGPTIDAMNAAIERRHEAALALAPEQVDRLLRECRKMIGPG